MQLLTSGPLQGVSAELSESNTHRVEIAADVQNGTFGVLLNKADGTSAYLSEASSGLISGRSFASNVWVHLGGDEYFRTVGYAIEGIVGGSLTIQKSVDGGATWTNGATYFSSSSHNMYEYSGWYDANADLGYVPALVGVESGKFSLVLAVFSNRMSQHAKTITLHDASASPWYRATEGRIIRLSSGTLLLPVYSSTDLFTAMDSPSGMFRCASGLDPSLATSWQYIEGFGCGTTRGMIECQAVEMPDGNVLLEANTRTGYLVQQVWSNDGLTPGPSQVTNITSPRTKSELLRLSDGTYARLWCASSPTGTREGPRANVVLGFSDDLVEWHDFHIVATGSYIYEPYLTEVAGHLRIRYWSWPTLVSGDERPYDKLFNLRDRQEAKTSRTIEPTGPLSAKYLSIHGGGSADVHGGFRVTRKSVYVELPAGKLEADRNGPLVIAPGIHFQHPRTVKFNI